MYSYSILFIDCLIKLNETQTYTFDWKISLLDIFEHFVKNTFSGLPSSEGDFLPR